MQLNLRESQKYILWSFFFKIDLWDSLGLDTPSALLLMLKF